MRIAFRAIRSGIVTDDDYLVCGLAGVDAAGMEHTLILERSPQHESTNDDWGVYLEFDDQVTSGYGSVMRCRLTREQLSLDLRQPLGELAIEGFDVALALDDESYRMIRTILPRILRGMADALVLS
jgi:hypothetical protein